MYLRLIFLSAATSPPYYRWEVDDLGPETLTRTIHIDGTIEDYLTANEQSVLLAIMQDAFQPVIKIWGPGVLDVGGEYFPDSVSYMLSFDVTTPTYNPAYIVMAIGLKVELFHND